MGRRNRGKWRSARRGSGHAVREDRVGNEAVQMRLDGMGFYDATEALIVITGRLTRKAKELCEGTKTRVVFYEREGLLDLCVARGIVLPSWSELAHDSTGELVDLGDNLVIGRQADCGHVVADDKLLPRRHLRLRWQGLGPWIEDLRSSNGTFVNGNRLASARLHYGDRISAGQQTGVLRPHQLDACLGIKAHTSTHPFRIDLPLPVPLYLGHRIPLRDCHGRHTLHRHCRGRHILLR